MKKFFSMFLALLMLSGCSANNGISDYAKTAPVLLVSAPPMSPVAKANSYPFLLADPRWSGRDGTIIEEWTPTEKMPFFDKSGITVCPDLQEGGWSVDCNGKFQLTATVDQKRLDKTITEVDQVVSVYVGCDDGIAVVQGKVSPIDLTLDGEQTLDVSFADSSFSGLPSPHTGVVVTLDTSVKTKKETSKYSCSEAFIILYDPGVCEDAVELNYKTNWSYALDEMGSLDVAVPFITMDREPCLELTNTSGSAVRVSVAASGKTVDGKPKLREIGKESQQFVVLPPHGKSRLFVENEDKNKQLAMVLDISHDGEHENPEESHISTYSPLIVVDTSKSEIITTPKK